MYVRVTSFTYDPAREEDVYKLADESLIPALKQMDGFVSYTTGGDDETGHGVAISVWDNMEHAAALRDALGSMIQQFEEAGVRLDAPQLYEVTRHVGA